MTGNVVGNSLSDEKNFQTVIATTPTEWIATMQPIRKDIRRMFQRIILHFNKQKSMVTAIELIEKNGDKTHIEFKNIRANEAISENLFGVH
jgi:outer membrane lipoprotein carrier protein